MFEHHQGEVPPLQWNSQPEQQVTGIQTTGDGLSLARQAVENAFRSVNSGRIEEGSASLDNPDFDVEPFSGTLEHADHPQPFATVERPDHPLGAHFGPVMDSITAARLAHRDAAPLLTSPEDQRVI